MDCEKLWKIIKYVTVLGDLELTEKLKLQIEGIIDEILDYCYRDDIPEEMIRPMALVIVNQLKAQNNVGIDGNVTSYKEGDMQITYGSVSEGVKYGGKLEGFKLVKGLIKNVQK